MSGPLMPLSLVAEMLGLDPSTVRRQAIAGRIRGQKVGPRAWVFDAGEVERYRAEQLGRPGRPKKEAAS